ncbi:MAG: heme-binding protein, partial [Actinobacteria bacterium]|nr:heme-binding protein [Actinomycetota bacterium]
MTQEQRFDSIGKVNTFELRRYHTCVIAEVSVKSDFESAGSSGFRPLFGYIAGANHSRAKVAMTSPVIQ